MADDIPPPPPGFTRQDIPPPPSGFTLGDQAAPEEPSMLQIATRSALAKPGMKAIKNIPGSALEFAKSTVYPITNFSEFMQGLKGLGLGVAEKAGLKEGTENEKYVDALKQHFVDRYGSLEAVKNTLETDPVGFLGDVSLPLTLGGSTAARAPGIIGKIGETVAAAGRTVDPLSATSRAVGAGYRKFAAPPIGVTTGTGAEALRLAEQSGYKGGEPAQAFRENITGREPMANVVAEARTGVNELYRQRGEAYRQEMNKLGLSYTLFKWNKVNDALKDITEIKTHKGLVVDEATATIRARIEAKVREWKDALGPYVTLQDLDALKQAVYNLKDVAPHTPEARVVAEAAGAIKKTIMEHNPKYGKIMNAYADASEQLSEIERTLSLNPNASVDTALRKLQSVLRDNVSTNYGQRRELADFLVQNGAPHLMERLAGQALHPAMPRGLSRLLAGEVTGRLAALAGLHGGAAAATGGTVLPFMSPRLMGEVAYRLGQGRRLTEHSGGTPFVAGKVSEQLDPRQVISNEATAALKDKNEFNERERSILQQVTVPDAPSSIMLQAKQVLERAELKRQGIKPVRTRVPQLPLSPEFPWSGTGRPMAPEPGANSYQGPI